MRICFVGLDNYAFLRPELGISHMGGEAVQQSLLAREFKDQNWSVSTVVLDYEEPDEGYIDGIKILRAYKPGTGIPGLRFFHPRISSIWRALKRADADIYYESPASILTGITAAFCRAFDRRFVFRIASDANCVPGEQLIGLWRDRKIYEYGLKRADIRAVQTRKQSDLLLKHYGLSSAVVNMVTEPVLSMSLEQRPVDILWVNNLRSVKRPDRVLSLARQLPQYNFVMVGGASRGAERLYSEIEAEARLLENLRFEGSRPFSYVNELLNQSKVLLNTSELEGFPNTYLQAWMRGVPVVATFDPDSLIIEERLGLSTEEEDDLAELLQEILSDDSERKEAAARAREYALERFSPNRVVQQYIELING